MSTVLYVPGPIYLSSVLKQDARNEELLKGAGIYSVFFDFREYAPGPGF